MNILKEYYLKHLKIEEKRQLEEKGSKCKKTIDQHRTDVNISRFYTNFNNKEFDKEMPNFYGMNLFVEKLKNALKNDQKICIYGDYDADGVSATSTLYLGLISLGFKKENLDYYIPSRFDESYGLNLPALKKLSKNFNLIITVDCGISAWRIIEDFQEYIKNQGLETEIIITDHHQLQNNLPKNTILINPQINSCNKNFTEQIEDYKHWLKLQSETGYQPEKMEANLASTSLVGTSIAWFCLIFLAHSLKIDLKILNNFLPLVAIGTIADCQSVMEKTNRHLIKAGLQIINKNNHNISGLKKIISLTKLNQKLEFKGINSVDIGFLLAPLLNAPGRMEHAKLAVDILTGNLEDEIVSTKEMISLNEKRKAMVKEAVTDIRNSEYENNMISKRIDSKNNKKNIENLEDRSTEEMKGEKQDIKSYAIIVVGDWSKGIIGLIASNLCNFYNLPTVVLTQKNDELTASVRAPKGYDIARSLNEIENENAGFFIKFGGHSGAAGFTLKLNNLELFKNIFNQKMKEQSSDISNQLNNNIDSEYSELPEIIQQLLSNDENLYILKSDLSQDLAKNIWFLEPFGQGLPLPNFILNLSDLSLENIKIFGNDGQYFKLLLNGITITSFNKITEKLKNILNTELSSNQLKSRNLKIIKSETETNSKQSETGLIKSDLWIKIKPSINYFNNKTYYEFLLEELYEI